MAEMFLELEGISGESLDFYHGNAMEIKDWQWTTVNDAPLKMNQDKATEHTKVTGVQVTKWCDRASVTLTQYCAIGKHIPTGWITCRKNAGDDAPVEFLEIEMTDVKITSVNWDAGRDQNLHETVKLDMAEFKVTYRLQDNDGTTTSSVVFGFDLPNHKQK